MKKIKNKINLKSGFSLIEIMIVLVIFTTITIIATQALISTLTLGFKAKSTIRVRNEVDYATSIIERHLHNSSKLVNCPNVNKKLLEYEDNNGVLTSFSCQEVNGDNYIASGSARLTSELISITSCNIECTESTESNPGSVQIDIKAIEKTRTGIEAGSFDQSSFIYLRSY